MLHLPGSSQGLPYTFLQHQHATVDKKKCWSSLTGLFNLWWAWESGTPRGQQRALWPGCAAASIPLASCRCTCQVRAGLPVHFLVLTTIGKSRICKLRINLFFFAQREIWNVTLSLGTVIVQCNLFARQFSSATEEFIVQSLELMWVLWHLLPVYKSML